MISRQDLIVHHWLPRGLSIEQSYGLVGMRFLAEEKRDTVT